MICQYACICPKISVGQSFLKPSAHLTRIESPFPWEPSNWKIMLLLFDIFYEPYVKIQFNGIYLKYCLKTSIFKLPTTNYPPFCRPALSLIGSCRSQEIYCFKYAFIQNLKGCFHNSNWKRFQNIWRWSPGLIFLSPETRHYTPGLPNDLPVLVDYLFSASHKCYQTDVQKDTQFF